MKRWILAALVSGGSMLNVTGTASAGDFVIPEAWEGVWDFTDLDRPCGESGGEMSQDLTTLCAGDPIFGSDPEDPFPTECAGTVSDTNIDITCTGSQEIDPVEFPGCFLTITYTLDATRTGESLDAIWTRSWTWEGCGPFFQDFCDETATTGTRTSDTPDCSGMPIESRSWTEIKSIF